MNLQEIENRLKEGYKLFCDDCHLFTKNEDCLIICCVNPFNGPSDVETEIHVRTVERYYKNKKIERVI